MLAFLAVRDPWIALLVMVPRGAGAVVAESVALTAVQRSTRAVGVSRVLVGFHSLLLAALVLGAAVAPLAQRLGGLSGLLVVGGAVIPGLALALAPVLVRRDREGRAHAQELAEKVAILVGLTIFDGARRVTLERLAARLRAQELSPGEVLLRQGEPAQSFSVLLSGTVDVRVDDGQLVRTVSAPAHLGEIGLLHRIARTATVIANGPVTVLRADGDEFLAALSDAPISPALADCVVTRLGATPLPSSAPARHEPGRRNGRQQLLSAAAR